MKRTTYILLGMILSGLLAIVVGIFVTSLQGNSQPDNELALGGEMKMKELPPFHAISFSGMDSETLEQVFYFESGGLQITPSTNEKNIFSCPQKAMECLDLQVINDTLKIKFNYPVDKIPDHLRNRDRIWIEGDSWNLQVAQDINYVNSRNFCLKSSFKGLSQDTLSIGGSLMVAVDSCRFASLNVWEARGLYLQSGEIDKLYLDLDGINNWEVDATKLRLHTEYLTGSNNSVRLQKDECKQMFWIPKKDDSQLQVTLTERSCITMGNE